MRQLALSTVVALLLCGCALAQKDRAQYPLQVSILESGRANLQSGASVVGIDLESACSSELEKSPQGHFYPAKWISPEATLRLRVVRKDSAKAKECDTRVRKHNEVYGYQAGKLALISQEEFAQWQAENEFAQREHPDLSDHPVRIFVISGDTAFTPAEFLGQPAGRFKGWGRGDIFDRWFVHGLEFIYECRGAVPSGQNYWAKWLEPEDQLELLVPVAGQKDRYYPCKITVEIKQEFYVRFRPAVSRPTASVIQARR